MLENMKYNAKAFYLNIQIGRLFIPWATLYNFFIRSEIVHKLKLYFKVVDAVGLHITFLEIIYYLLFFPGKWFGFS